MKIDCHTHGKLAKKLPFSSEYTDWLFSEAKLAGLDAICLTEHFNTLGFREVYEYISDNYIRQGDAFICKGLRIFPGMEVDIAEGGHILVIGKMEEILELNQRLEPYKEKSTFLSFVQLIEMIKEYAVIVGAGHPYREGGHIPKLEEELLREFDFLDLNGKDMAIRAGENIKQIEGLSKALGIPVVAGSDTHQSFQYGCIWNDFEKDCDFIEELREEIAKRHFRIEISKQISFKVKTAGILKRALKEIHTLEGDYVSVLLKEAK